MGENFSKNLELVKKVEEIAAGKKCTPGQIALAWIFEGKDIVPIPEPKNKNISKKMQNQLRLRLHLTN